MLAKRIVACLDVAGGRVVKGIRFQRLRQAGEPVSNALRYCHQGIDELTVLDVSATRESRDAAFETVASIARAIDVPLTAGGGVRTLGDVERYLEAGADKVAINSAAFAEPALLERCSRRFGAQCIVLSIDAVRFEGGYRVATHGGSVPHQRDALDWAVEGEARGAGEVLVTSIDRDGTRSGFDLELVALLAARLRVPLVASGGARGASCFAGALGAGADAALGASVFHDGDCSVGAVKRFCASRGLEIRP